LASVLAGDQLLGVLYNFVYRGRVYSYQSGFDYSDAARHCRPGLVLHSLLIEHNAKLGHVHYDLMAGDSQYKRSLGTRSETLQWVICQRDSLKFRVENRLRALKQRLTRVLQPAPNHGSAGGSGAESEDQA
jgi:CelD/BcsL family acetyltransferase involved in cellulose biosynthesis